MNNETIVILQERMAGYLMFRRFHKIGEKRDLKNSQRNIYIFKDSPEIRNAMEEYKTHKELMS
ncbi:hypothetical protein CPAST_c24440 [Clostridium pasteurianum DSM 525 = ATCC 6013]|uniref:DUF5659 domain-containing protein n=1 Tax=Clostridium pasteurianum DSM 525 = ATCC 6013 TaxID=1262449 RepID=A0A0H3J4U0_CLOPA|nr:DUF5659 domain-containing protein [Clostridium pasteurianum]AJA48514.1 hypothetical protein CPAST_c24440 [Clostridium pasteurianum DSM 525 = ATCC 6013]AJA52502.1 hypothetical protein CLPA_c24440 [Clostridium pasteurianum DSM 525 = ATCC 6013]AOZ75753.1 hypothetical protein AQ983_11880 [Clostridium pasteurianum DSM 525 = ATCC 6013]AOZ79549.1 hypothetical protein AQ984_11875 [Clostridium pasteurianum]ELP60340.1 hypothetical protein F502_02607 [Clostridium pasteurianum DSM 525 = ATCC 6013]